MIDEPDEDFLHPDTSEDPALAASPEAGAAQAAAGSPGTKIRNRSLVKYVAVEGDIQAFLLRAGEVIE